MTRVRSIPTIAGNLYGRAVAAMLVLGGMVILAAAPPAVAQELLRSEDLTIESKADCRRLADRLAGKEDGGQWIIGSGIELFGQPASRTPIDTLNGAFTHVTCYKDVKIADQSRVFVADDARELCGWIDRNDLLDEHRQEDLKLFKQEGTAVCETPRPMPFDQFCRELKRISSSNKETCDGVPPGLWAKGVLIGSTNKNLIKQYPFLTAPKGGIERSSRAFFSVFVIHDVKSGDGSDTMALVGDGEGDMFGWINLNALELWPTRMGLFYDKEGRGRMFQSRGKLVQNWRTGEPEARIKPGLGSDELKDYIDGGLQLLSYPIIRTVDPKSDPLANPEDVGYHEVIFLGQTGEGSASDLMAQAELARRVESVGKFNVMFVVDTTESMRDYLPLVREGIAQFIRDYGRLRLDESTRLPAMRIAVYAYSDFLDRDKTGLNDPISTRQLMPPTAIGPGYDLTAALAGITNHQGLDDVAGLREEAALEAVYQLGRRFASDGAWFNDGPRVIIHIADHGSRSKVVVDDILKGLRDVKVHYFPVAVVTDDKNETARRMARLAFFRQAKEMLAPIVEGPVTDDDVRTIDLLDYRSSTPQIVRKRLDDMLDAAIEATSSVRSEIVGKDLVTNSRRARDRVSSRITLDEKILAERGLGNISDQVIVQADTGFAPLAIKESGRQIPLDWTYTVSLSSGQARFLRQNFESMCEMVGKPEQHLAFRNLIVKLAEAFSGDVAENDDKVRAILADLKELPGADQSFLSQSPRILLERADSTDPDVIEDLRKDVCWVSYHLGNMKAEIYARADQVEWTTRGFSLKPGNEVIKRLYTYKPVVGAETVYLPSFFFVAPSVVKAQAPAGPRCQFFCD